MILLDGLKASASISERLKKSISKTGRVPALAVIQVGNRPESNSYIKRKELFGLAIGAKVFRIRLSEDSSDPDISAEISKLNSDSSINGILLQLPLPKHLDKNRLINLIDENKDTDGLSSANVKKRKNGEKGVIAATARGVVELLEYYSVPIKDKKAVVLGRSDLVGDPLVDFLKMKGAEVTSCDSKTENVAEITKASDIVAVAIGKPRLIGENYFRKDKSQTVVDIGITAVYQEGTKSLLEEVPKIKLVGDVDFDRVKELVGAISPVPGGVGPMTVAALFENLLDSAGMVY